MAAPLRRFVHASLAVVFIVSSYSSYAHANPEEIEQHQDAENDDDNSISHHTNRGGGQGLSGISWTDDIQWKEGQEKTDGSSTENDEQRRRREERERRKREKEEKKQHEREERERRQRERDERRRQEREDRERREQERRDRNRRGPAPAPAPRPPIRTSSDSDTAMARWLRSMGYGPADWMKLSPALRNELNRMAMQDMMKARSGMPSTLPPSPEMRAALQKLMEGARAGGAAFGNARSWMNSEDMQGGNSIQGLRNLLQGGASGGGGSFVTEDGRTVTPQPPTEFGPWPGETEEEWVERLAQNLWQSTYDKALWDIQQQRIAREAMGYRESSINEYQRRLAAQQSGYDPQVEADKAYAQWLADLAAKNAQDPQYREYLKNASEEDLAKQNLNRDGTMRVHMGVAHRGEGMGPQLDFSKRDAADAAERRAQTASLQRQRAETAAQLARWDAERAQRSEQRAADNEARRQQRIADASAQRAGQPAAAREPATATWVDGQGNTVHWTSNNGRSTVTTIDGQGHA
ncbi:MAG TPA: hypothetical protein VL688_05930, partial [Verrucomicrobiae bacterium]|nr:hypothetical protein [Verrucomicrobiae bacterium]